MKIGVISDTHGSLYFFEMAMSYLKDCDKIIHAGDILYHGPRMISLVDTIQRSLLKK